MSLITGYAHSPSISTGEAAESSVRVVPVCEYVRRNLSYLTAGHYGPRIGVLENICPFCTFPSPDRKGLREEGTEERFSKDGRGRGKCYLFTGVDFIFKSCAGHSLATQWI